MIGRIHSCESFGTVDGPGVRFVVFFQGCPMRCLYCHNPDTHSTHGGTPMTAAEVIAAVEKNRAFYRNGGLTATGGEPLLQAEFLCELFEKAKEKGIHTCLDTSGFYPPALQAQVEQVLQYTDLLMLDIKHIDAAKHRALTGQDNARILAFAELAQEKQIPLWVRHVVVPGYTDDPEALLALGREIGTWQNLQALDVLPYHTMGVGKYRALGLPYPLEGVPAATKAQAQAAKQQILRGIHEVRKKEKG